MTRLSNRQFPLMQSFANNGSAYVSIHECQKWDQRPFRSLLVHEWISYTPGKGFRLTAAGREAWREFRETEIWRKNPDAPLTALFDPAAFGLSQPYRRVHEMPLRHAGAA